MTLRINEIYYSIQGESSFAGQPCVFIRTTGCSLRCRWCDTDYAFYEGQQLSIENILQQVEKYQCPLVEVTGGEPLDQQQSLELMTRLCDEGYTVLLETGGHRPIEEIDSRVHRIIDIKCPSSKMMKRNRWDNLKHLTTRDELKFVIANRDDYLWACKTIRAYELEEQTTFFSPVYHELSPKLLAEWILEDQLKVRLQVQLHKAIWGAEARGT